MTKEFFLVRLNGKFLVDLLGKPTWRADILAAHRFEKQYAAEKSAQRVRQIQIQQSRKTAGLLEIVQVRFTTKVLKITVLAQKTS